MNSLRSGSHEPSCRRNPVTVPSTILAWMPVSRFQCGARKVGFIPMIRADGSNGIAVTIWVDGCLKRMRGKSGAGMPCAATWPRSTATVNGVTRPAASARDKPCSIGPMTAERSEAIAGCKSTPTATPTSAWQRRTRMSGRPLMTQSGHGADHRDASLSSKICQARRWLVGRRSWVFILKPANA